MIYEFDYDMKLKQPGCKKEPVMIHNAAASGTWPWLKT